MKLSKSIKVIGIALAVAVLASPTAYANIALTGAGATFPGPLIEACKVGYNKDTGNSFTYGLGGSGAGRTASDKETSLVNFSDTPHTAARAGVIHAPVIAGPIAVIYNIGNNKPLYLSPATVAGIFGGTITKWNDPKIVAENNRSIKETIFKTDGKGVTLKDKAGKPIVLREITRQIRYTLPNKSIKVVYRSDSSGTSGNFTDALNKLAPTVWTKPGNNVFATSFPGTINAVGNLGRIVGQSQSAGVVALAAKTQYSITYAESSFAKSAGLAVANIQNASGSFQAPNSAGVSAFLGASTISDKGYVTYDFATKDPGAYVFGSISYAMVDTKQKDAATAKAVKDLLTYFLDPKCPNSAPELEYTSITGKFRDANLALIAKITS